MSNRFYKVYKVSEKLGKGIRKAQTEGAGYGSAFGRGVAKGYKGPKAPVKGGQSHLKKHWRKYANVGLHVGGGGIAYGAGLKHGASLKDYNPYQRNQNQKLERAFKRLNNEVNKAVKQKLKERS